MSKQTGYPQESRPGHIRQRDYRARLRSQGLRPIELWVPDTRSPQFAEECRRQSACIADYERRHAVDYDFWEMAADTEGWKT